MTTQQTQPLPFKNTFFAIASHPFVPALDGTFTFITRAVDDQSTQFVPVYYNHLHDEDPIGLAEIAYIPCHKTKEGRNLCIAFATLKTNVDLVLNQPVSIAFSEVFHKNHVRFADEITELSIVDKGTTGGCTICDPKHFPEFISAIQGSTEVMSLFSTVLKSIGEINEK